MSGKELSQWQRSAARYLTGGMSSSFRANQFTGEPMYAVSAAGPRFRDVTGKEYIDFFMCHGAVLLGHDQPAVKQAVIQSLEKGFYAGLDSEDTIEFARKVCEAVPAAEQIRFVNSGSEGGICAVAGLGAAPLPPSGVGGGFLRSCEAVLCKFAVYTRPAGPVAPRRRSWSGESSGPGHTPQPCAAG